MFGVSHGSPLNKGTLLDFSYQINWFYSNRWSIYTSKNLSSFYSVGSLFIQAFQADPARFVTRFAPFIFFICFRIPNPNSNPNPNFQWPLTIQSLKVSWWRTILPHQVKRSICISDFMQTTFFYLGRFLKKLADDQWSSITKGSIYHIKHIYIQPFTTVVEWPDIRCLMEVSTMFSICRYCVFTWDGRINKTKILVYFVQGIDWLYCCLLPIDWQ